MSEPEPLSGLKEQEHSPQPQAAPAPPGFERVRRLARRFLPSGLRKPLGSAAGWFSHGILQPIQGAAFDLCGGRFRADGCTFVIPKDQTSRAYRSCFFDGSYEAEERAFVRAFVRPNDTVLELGACLGIVSCVTNKILANKSKHVVVEGNPFCIPTIHRNRELNQCGFLVENCAVSNQRDAVFYLHPVYIVGGTTQRATARAVRVPSRSLVDLNSRYGPFTVLIMDVEGSELDLLEASTEALAGYRLVIVELHPWIIGDASVERCRQILADAGLRFQTQALYTEVWTAV
ncbi:MAG TPA: FkbM family methyltransferase [Verrucomicrobiae bacterium]|nr:FkbM family methyltransferase [Verrucomicrobiae bacterium]